MKLVELNTLKKLKIKDLNALSIQARTPFNK
jgi:hypothetical protein